MNPKPASKRPSLGQWLWMGSGVLLALGVFLFLSRFIACWRLTSLPGAPPSTCRSLNPLPPSSTGTPMTATDNASPTPTAVAAPPLELPPAWDGASRITILFLGLDYRDWLNNAGAPRSDTMMLVTLDPQTKTVSLLSVPRDMWVNIPGFGYNKINAAYADGEAAKLPGGGPALAVKTVENFLGVNIQYYAEVDFQTFEQLIDTIGGIDVNVPAKITVDPLGPHNTTTLEPGMQHMDGALALAYARMRHTALDDIDRAGRQQQVILAIRQKVLSGSNFPALVLQAPQIYEEVSAGIHTNLSLNDALRLAVLAKDIPLDLIQKYVIDYSMCSPGNVEINGIPQDILRPFPDKIRALVGTVFGTGTVSPQASGTLVEKMQQEAARVLVIDASGGNGVAQKTADYLKSQGMNVTGVGTLRGVPDGYHYPPLPGRTELILHAGKPYAVQYLMQLMKFDAVNQLVIDYDPSAPADIVLAVGADWAISMP